MGMIAKNPKLQAGFRAQRNMMSRIFPKFAERMKPIWDKFAPEYEQPNQQSATATSMSLGTAPPLPQAGGRTSKTLLGS